MGLLAKRIITILGGIFLLYINSAGGPDGTFLGFYPPDSAQRIGFDAAKAAIALLAIWIIARGFGLRFRTRASSANEPRPGKGADHSLGKPDRLPSSAVVPTSVSGPRRLAIFVTVLWLFALLVLSMIDGGFNAAFFLLLGVFPPAVLWGAWWVWRGFR